MIVANFRSMTVAPVVHTTRPSVCRPCINRRFLGFSMTLSFPAGVTFQSLWHSLSSSQAMGGTSRSHSAGGWSRVGVGFRNVVYGDLKLHGYLQGSVHWHFNRLCKSLLKDRLSRNRRPFREAKQSSCMTRRLDLRQELHSKTQM